MTQTDSAPAAASSDAIPTFAELAADPAIAPLLRFEPVPRKVDKMGGWNAGMQRRFIAFLAWYGSPTKAADELGKARSGIDKVYKSPGADSFRESWIAAVALAEERRIATMTARSAGAGSLRAPTLSRGLPAPANHPDLDEDDDEDRARKLEVIEAIVARFMRKVAVERAARLGGEIVAADFYLRQITYLEVLFDLGTSLVGANPTELLRDLRRCGKPLLAIASTPFSEALDAQRRAWWAAEGDPERPPHPDARFLQRHSGRDGECSTNIDDNTYGGASTPALGYTGEQWASLSIAEQERARERQHAEDAARQREWEAHAIAEWRESTERSDSE